MKTHVVFDFDGTLFDTRELVERAYEAIGVEMPPSAWGKPASEWLPAIAGDKWLSVRNLKSVAYRAMIEREGLRPLPALNVLKALQELTGVQLHVFTGADVMVVFSVLKRYNLHGLDMHGSMTTDAKCEELLELGPRGIYFDDDPDAAAYIADATGWAVLLVGPDATEEELMKGFKEATEWTA